MTLEQRHTQASNKLAAIFVFICEAFMMASTLMYAPGRLVVSTAFMVIPQVLLIVATIVVLMKFGSSSKSRVYYMVIINAAYFFVLLGSIHVPYLYAFAPMILITAIIYQDKKLTKFTAIYLVVINFIYLAYCITLNTNFGDYRFQNYSDAAFAFLESLMAFFCVSLLSKHNDEKVEEIQNQAQQQKEAADNIQYVAETIASKLEDADVAMEALSEKVYSSAEAVDQISSSVNMTAEAIQTQTEMNSNITESLHNIANEASEMSSNSDEVTAHIQNGNNLIKELEIKSAESSRINEESALLTKNLQASAETVNDIVSTILAISSQTNLLALNASIEAARAGEAGKGFAVVADEIRQLSENTKTSAEQIADTISELIKSVNIASENMNKSYVSSNEQSEMVTKTGAEFAAILTSVNELADRVKSISTSVDECVDANTQVMDAISNLSATSEEVAASSETSLTLSKDCEVDMQTTKQLLDDILDVSRNSLNK